MVTGDNEWREHKAGSQEPVQAPGPLLWLCHLSGHWDLIISEMSAGTSDLLMTLWNKSDDEEPNIPFHLDQGTPE